MGPMSDTTTPAPPAPVSPPLPPLETAGRRWLRRLVILALLAVAVAALAYGAANDDTGPPGVDPDPAIVAQFPAPDARALRQTQVGAELKPGYDGRLVVNGVEIPEDQLEGAIDPSSVSPEELRRYGIRPNNRHRVIFQPGDGKVIEELPQGEVVIVLRYFRERRSEDSGRSVTWTITVD
jgi:hypothetical protein